MTFAESVTYPIRTLGLGIELGATVLAALACCGLTVLLSETGCEPDLLRDTHAPATTAAIKSATIAILFICGIPGLVSFARSYDIREHERDNKSYQ